VIVVVVVVAKETEEIGGIHGARLGRDGQRMDVIGRLFEKGDALC
jgi:hypothetical protein